jgi:Fe-S cluster assembly scaffold protein SufB
MHNFIEEVKEYENLLVVTNGKLTSKTVNDNFEVIETIPGDKQIGDYYAKALKDDKNPSETVIFVKQKQSASDMIQIVFVYDGENDVNEHLIVVNEKFSKLNVIENRISLNDAEINVLSKVEVFVNDESITDYLVFNDLRKNINTRFNRHTKVYRNGKYNCAFAELSDGNTFGDYYTDLASEGAQCDSKAVTIVKEDKKQQFDININHSAKHTVSHNLNRAVVDDKGSAVFNAIGFIAKGYSQSKCFQDSKMLTLSPDAKTECNPILLIDEYDVEANHAAAVGQMDEESMYYLQSRGLTKKQCEKLLIYGFLMPVAEVIESEELKEKFITNITKKLNI